MRLIAASLKDSYHVHKTMNEYLSDIGLPPLGQESYAVWADVFSDTNQRYCLMMHGKKVVGMIWGRAEKNNSFLLEGKFLRRAYRGKFRFTRKLRDAKIEITKGYGTIKEVRPACAKIGKRKVQAFIL